MCKDCGCSIIDEIAIDGNKINNHTREHLHPEIEKERDLTNGHSHEHQKHIISVRQGILDKNDRLAERNRGYFQAKDVLVLNVLSSPGSGKTALIERMLRDCASIRMGVIVGDLATDNDARRLRSAGAPAVQITTRDACHLEADMIARAIKKLDLDNLDVLVIENVGNLVCPAAYDLGEDLRVVLLSVTEGEDKPLKYPTMFKTAQVVIINKIDIAEAVGFDREKAIAFLQQMAPQAKIFEVSARTGQGMNDWYAYLQSLSVKG
ncbi:hydrogenase nickel incorporation protein HypB [Pleurocapsales cyanobacterium LEGE 06147]|nr:hydrogenase nickel incorporation protein HypB [Pleurocapsales cyanobacterium LEGE 06147]